MNEWGVVGVIIALVGFLATIIKPLTNLTRSITELTVVVKRLQRDLQEQESSAHESHKRLWEHNNKQDDRLEDHEHRLIVLETNKGGTT